MVSKKLPMIKSFAHSLKAETERNNETTELSPVKAAIGVTGAGEVPLIVAFGLEVFEAASCRSCWTRSGMDASLNEMTGRAISLATFRINQFYIDLVVIASAPDPFWLLI